MSEDEPFLTTEENTQEVTQLVHDFIIRKRLSPGFAWIKFSAAAVAEVAKSFATSNASRPAQVVVVPLQEKEDNPSTLQRKLRKL